MLPKVFVIGFNKCDTTSLHRMFERAGHKSSHHRHVTADGNVIRLALRMEDNDARGRRLLDGIDDALCYSDLDMCLRRAYLSGIGRFRTLDLQYPGSRFILNTRDPARWLESRSRHRGGGYLARAMAQAGASTQAQMCGIWLRDWHAHHAAVRAHFAHRPDRLLVFDIERDDPQRICDFLPRHGLRPRHWSHANRTRTAAEVLAMTG